MTTIAIKGLEEITAKLKKLEDLKAIVPALKAGALHVERKVKAYPPSSEANVPMQRRWYERGYGPKWTLKDGTVHGKKTSEDLRGKWTIGERNSGLTWVVGNNVSYAEFVQNREKQSPFHTRRGWRTVQDVTESEGPVVVEMIEKEINRILNS